jgi:uncharacterized protein (DUF58 family)
MIGPSRRLVLGLVLCSVPFVLDLWVPGLSTLGGLATGAFALLLALDLACAPRRKAYEVEIGVRPVVSLAEEEAVPVRVRNRSGAGGEGWIRAVFPEPWQVARPVERIAVPARGAGEAVFRVTPRKRGLYLVGPVHLRLPSPIGFFWRDHRFEGTSPVKVYPAVSAIKKYALLSRRLRTRELGFRTQRVRGQGMEFARLREHHPDDELRSIDWKATARRGRLISREYQVERCQNVVMMIDAGRMLTEEVDGIVKIEYVLNAALLLTRIAAEYDDRVGALVFADRVDRLTPLRKGHAAVRAMAEALYDVEPRLVEANYDLAFDTLHARCRKRALVVLFTNLVDQGVSGLVSAQLRSLAWRHVPLCVAVGDRETRDIAWSEPRTLEEAYRKGAAAQLLVSRARTLQDLQRRGVHVVDAPAGQVPLLLINKYLDLKSRQVL